MVIYLNRKYIPFINICLYKLHIGEHGQETEEHEEQKTRTSTRIQGPLIKESIHKGVCKKYDHTFILRFILSKVGKYVS